MESKGADMFAGMDAVVRGEMRGLYTYAICTYILKRKIKRTPFIASSLQYGKNHFVRMNNIHYNNSIIILYPTEMPTTHIFMVHFDSLHLF